MGLDMYLEIDRYVSVYRDADKPALAKLNEAIGTLSGSDIPTLNSRDSVSVTTGVGYWRKANAIHNWFVENVQGGVDECQRSYVDPETLEQLSNVCRELTDLYEDESTREIALQKADEKLPVAEGFFFGGQEYDEYYWDDVKETAYFLEEFLKWHEKNREWSIHYQSSW